MRSLFWGSVSNALELADGRLVVVFVVEIDLAQTRVRLGVIRVRLVRAGVGLDGRVDVALLGRALADLQVVLVQDDPPLARAVLHLLVELHDLFPVAVVLSDRELDGVESEADRLASSSGVLPNASPSRRPWRETARSRP